MSLVAPALSFAQCPDSSYFTVNTPYCYGNPVAFTNASSGAPTGFQWDFGDPGSGINNSSATTSPSHTFTAAGTYYVCLIATYAACKDTLCRSVVVDNPPVANFSF